MVSCAETFSVKIEVSSDRLSSFTELISGVDYVLTISINMGEGDVACPIGKA